MEIPQIYIDSGAVVMIDGRVQFNPEWTYIMFRGGRGRGGSWTMVTVAVIMSLQEKMDILVLRQTSAKIKDSVWKLINDTARRLGVEEHFKQTNTYIETTNGSRFIYDYMHNNEQGIKSKEGIRLTLGEECQQYEDAPLSALKPTVLRSDDSQFVGCMNPYMDDDPIEKHIVNDEDCLVVNATYLDNPFIPQKLIREAEKLKKNDIEMYSHIYMGQFLNLTEEMVVGGRWVVEDFATPDNAVFYHGMDWSNGGEHPHAATRSFIVDNTLYIDWEMKNNLELVDDFFDAVGTCPTLNRENNHTPWVLYCDEANPANRKIMTRNGFTARKADKNFGTHGSVVAGVSYLRRFDRIVIHTRCPKMAIEASRWRWKKDKRTGDILPILVDGNDDLFASLRYSHWKQIKKGA